MPKDTFFNISEDRRERILACAIEEFSNYDYAEANISRIVKNAKIAKGSFYQYFEDKMDLFIYIVNQIGEKKQVMLAEFLDMSKDIEIFDLLRGMYASGVKFAFENPELMHIANRLFKSSDKELLDKINKGNEDQASAYFVSLFKKAQEKGELREDMDLELMAHMIISYNYSFVEYYYKKYDNFADNGEYERMANQMIDLLAYGIKKVDK